MFVINFDAMKFTVLILFALTVAVSIPDTDARSKSALYKLRRETLSSQRWSPFEHKHERMTRETGFVPAIEDPKCHQQGYCETLRDYPNEFVNELLSRIGMSWKYFVDKTDAAEKIPLRGNLNKMWNLCNSTEQLLSFQAARDHVDHQKWHYVLHGEPYNLAHQKFRVDICDTENESCSDVVGVYQGYKTSCMQKYQLRKVTVVNDQGALDVMDVMLPSACVCTIRIEDLCPMHCSLPNEPQKIV